ncbi:MarR family transcriptional regulator, partial [Nonomuraea sp. RK-328]|nr:MarR family transcriptional regulator [Nonomuraea sp. RK-328]
MMDPREGEFVDRMGLVMERLGGTRTMGRLYAWLMICEPSHQSLTELAGRLGVSKTAVSTVARQLEIAGMIERVPTAGREHRYQIAAGGWEHVLKVQLAAVRLAVETLDLGLAAVGGDRPAQRGRLEETREFFDWTLRDADDMLRRWRDSRENPDQ